MKKIIEKIKVLNPKITRLSNKHFFKNMLLIWILFPRIVCAQSSESPVGQGLQYFINAFVYGTDGITIATLAIAGVGLCCMKRIFEWPALFYTVGGISVIFGAPAIVQGIKGLVTA